MVLSGFRTLICSWHSKYELKDSATNINEAIGIPNQAILKLENMTTPKMNNQKSDTVEVARINARSAIVIAIVTAIAGLLTGYFSRPATTSDASNENVSRLELEITTLKRDLENKKISKTKSESELVSIKQRVRDILGPKEDFLSRMSISLERIKDEENIPETHRIRLEDIASDLKRIDGKILGIVEN